MRVSSINLAELSTIEVGGREETTGIFKRPVKGPVMTDSVGLVGDHRVAPRSATDNAISVYPQEHYRFWEHNLRRTISTGMFGENLTVEDGPEDILRIGDVLHGDEVVMQVSQPRTPCRKLNAVFEARLSGSFLETGRTGYYLRVLQRGMLAPGEHLRVETPDPPGPTVRHFVEATLLEYWNEKEMSRIQQSPHLTEYWRETVGEKIERARRAKGWIGLRRLEVLERLELNPGVRLRLRCPRGLTLPALPAGASLGLAIRVNLTEPHARPRSYPSAQGSGENPNHYVVDFDQLPLDVEKGTVVRATAPQVTKLAGA